MNSASDPHLEQYHIVALDVGHFTILFLVAIALTAGIRRRLTISYDCCMTFH